MLQKTLNDLQSEYVNGNLTKEAYEKLRREYEEKIVANRKKPVHTSHLNSLFSSFLAFSMAFRCLRRHKARTTLTVLGIMVGVTAIVSLSAVSEGMQQQMTGWIESSSYGSPPLQ